jgi:hypothetical protein
MQALCAVPHGGRRAAYSTRVQRLVELGSRAILGARGVTETRRLSGTDASFRCCPLVSLARLRTSMRCGERWRMGRGMDVFGAQTVECVRMDDAPGPFGTWACER